MRKTKRKYIKENVQKILHNNIDTYMYIHLYMVSLWYLRVYGIKYVRGYIKHFLKWPMAFSLELDGFSIELKDCRLSYF